MQNFLISEYNFSFTQQVLKERLNRGVPMDLDQGEFSVHECASVLKSFLSELPEPLLTDRFFHAHCQVANKIIKYFAPNHSAESSGILMWIIQLLFMIKRRCTAARYIVDTFLSNFRL